MGGESEFCCVLVVGWKGGLTCWVLGGFGVWGLVWFVKVDGGWWDGEWQEVEVRTQDEVQMTKAMNLA